MQPRSLLAEPAEEPRRRGLRLDSLEALARAAHDRQDAALYLTAAYTGLRQGELLGLRWREVDLVAGLVHVRRNFTNGVEKMPKGKRVRSAPMMPRVADELARLKDRGHLAADDDLVFCHTAGDHLDAWALRRRSTWRSSGPVCGGSDSTISGTSSARSRSRCSRPTPSSPTRATSTTRPHSATCTAGRGHRTRCRRAASTGGRRRPECLPAYLPNRGELRRTERTGHGLGGGCLREARASSAVFPAASARPTRPTRTNRPGAFVEGWAARSPGAGRCPRLTRGSGGPRGRDPRGRAGRASSPRCSGAARGP
jgi:Phage integrase family